MYQTRRWSGEVREFPTFTEANEDAKDPEVWKISWEIQPGIRIRLKREEAGFVATLVIEDGIHYVGVE